MNPSDPLPANSHTLATCDVYLLAYLLERCEEITFSTHSMKALLRRNQRKLPKDSLLECLEFMTDIPRDISISTCGIVGNLADLCIKKNEANYRRARDLRLPPLWAEHGVGIFQILFDGGNVYLQDRFIGATGMIRDPELLQNSSQGLKDWLISSNFSRYRACVQRCGVVSTLVPCMFIIPQVHPNVAKRPRLALPGLAGEAGAADGGVEAAVPGGALGA